VTIKWKMIDRDEVEELRADIVEHKKHETKAKKCRVEVIDAKRNTGCASSEARAQFKNNV